MLVTETSKDFRHGRVNLLPLNQTHIALIPKVPNPDSTSQFRPISLCNNSYKILSKLLANRLKAILPSLISHNQNAFVPNRQIQDNILLAHETFHYLKLKREGGNHELGLKIDMNKAYDRVEWDFLEAALLKFGFDRLWVRLVMSCVTTVSYSIVINGNAGKFFRPKRGLRQGDPLSPYLFLLTSEVLSLRITKAVNDGQLTGIKLSRSCPVISHLYFADDALYFLKATLSNCWKLKLIFSDFCSAYGQLINNEKSSIYFSPNTPSQMQVLMCELLDISLVDHPGTYLGLPTIWGKSKSEALSYIKERVNRKIESWKINTLSPAGKEILIKSVASAVPAYPMSCFKFPASVCNDINSSLSNFWWGGTDSNHKLHWKSWSHLGKPKLEGGLGFRDLNSFNMALLAKQCWRLIQEPDSFWAQVIKARYFPCGDFLSAIKGYRASWSWSSLIEARDLIFSGSRWQLGNGLSIKIWDDKWLPPPHDGQICPLSIVPASAPSLVHHLINWNCNSWNLRPIMQFLPLEVSRMIGLIPIGDVNDADRLIWPWNRNGEYTVKSGYHWHHTMKIKCLPNMSHNSHQVNSKCWKTIWNLKVLPKIKFFFWRALSNAVPSSLLLFRRKVSRNPSCPIFRFHEESIEHVLLLCPWVEAVWFGSLLGYKLDKRSITTLDIWIMDMCSCFPSTEERNYFLSMIGFLCWSIWKSRCSFVYQGSPLSPSETINRAISSLYEFKEANSPLVLAADNVPLGQPLVWTPPQAQVIKVNCDAAWDSITCSAGIGVILRDSSGLCIGGMATPSSCASAELAEAEAILDGLLLAKDLNCPRVLVSSDSLGVINNIHYHHTRGSWRIYPILNKIRRCAVTFADISWEWSPREANRAAHAAASLATRVVNPHRWASVPPPSLSLVLRNDGLPCPPFEED